MTFSADNCMLFGAMVHNWISVWLTPIWILGLGVGIGMAVLLIAWGIIALVNREAGRRIPGIVREGPLWPIFLVCALLSAFACIAWFVPVNTQVKPEEDYAGSFAGEVFRSLMQLPSTGIFEKKFVIKPDQERKASQSLAADGDDDAPGQLLEISFNKTELYLLRMNADSNLTVSAYPEIGIALRSDFAVLGGEENRWLRGFQNSNIFPEEEIKQLYAWNPGTKDVTLTVTLETAPDLAQVRTIPVIAVSLIGLFSVYFLLYVLAPKLSAIMLATAKSEMAKPMFMIVMALGFVALFFFLWIPYNSFGEDIKMMKDSGLTLIKILALVVGFWAAGSSVNDEIEGRTALTVLSKPVGRRQFIIGKFLGILWVLAVMFVLLGIFFLLLISYKPIYDSREMADQIPQWTTGHFELMQTIPGLVLGLMEATVLIAIGVAISTRLPLLANFIICTSIYVIGNLTPLLVKSSVLQGGFEPVVFIGRLVATILPVLEHFNMQAAIAGGRIVPYSYLLIAGIYCIIYSTVAMLLALVLFEDRDLA